jgi:lysophospholipase L1-like esterase
MAQHSDDSEMSRFDREGVRRFNARQSVFSVVVVMLILVVFSGGSVLRAGEEQAPGIGRHLITAVGEVTSTIAGSLPFQEISHTLTSPLNPNVNLDSGAGFKAGSLQARGSVIPPITPEAFDPVEIGGNPPPRKQLESVLVTGDSLSQPLDTILAQKLSPDGVEVIRDSHPGTGISNTTLVDWGELSTAQVAKSHPDAVVAFIGANEGYPLPGPGGKSVPCCGPRWAAIFASRLRQMMNTYRQAGAARVYWLTVPTPRDSYRQTVENTVNAAIRVAAEPWMSQIRIVDTVPIFTPGERYRDAIDIGGNETIVRESDGIHLNDAGSTVAADAVLRRMKQDFNY